MFKGLNILEFTEKFSTDDKCREYLSEIKWQNGYQCGTCGHEHYHKGNGVGTRVCSKCKYSESVTARTLFHKVKFSLRKAFHIVYTMACTKKSLSSHEFSRQLGLRQKTCWYFVHKVQEAMHSSGNNLLEGRVEVDEFFVGGSEAGKTGRGNDKKQLVAIAIEVDAFGIHRCYANVIENAGSDELSTFLEAKVAKDTIIRADKWTGYIPCKDSFPNLKQEKSDKGKGFPFMHRQIMMFKAWLRGIHHYCTHLQRYLDEYCYRFNRLKYPETLFHNLITAMVRNVPLNSQKIWSA